MSRTDSLNINARTISVNQVPIAGSAAAVGPYTTFDQLDADIVLALNGVVIQGTPYPGMVYTNFDNVNVLSGVGHDNTVDYGTPSTPATNAATGPINAATGGVVPPTLNALTVSNPSGTAGVAFVSSVIGKTTGSTLSLTGPGAVGLSVVGAAISGTPTNAGAVNIVETLLGATNTPRTTNALITIAAAAGLPTMTSGNAFSVDEDQPLAAAITFSGPVTVLIGGDDAIHFELNGTQPGSAFTLRWFSNGTKDYDYVDDFNTDHIYTITLNWTNGVDSNSATINVTLNQVVPPAVNTWNPAAKNANITLSNGNLTATSAAFAGRQMVKNGAPLAPSATAFFEVTVVQQHTDPSSAIYVGLAYASAPLNDRVGRDGVGVSMGFGSFGFVSFVNGVDGAQYYGGDPAFGGGVNGDVWRFEMSGGNLVMKQKHSGGSFVTRDTRAIPSGTGNVYPTLSFDTLDSSFGIITADFSGWV